MRLFRKRKIVLALGGGGARGLAGIGVLKAMEEEFGQEKMPFDMIIGTSIGSLIGASYCLGINLDFLEQKALAFSWPKIVDLGFHSTGIVKGDKFENIIYEIIDDKGFSDLKKPFALTTTDIETGETMTHTDGDLLKLIRASCSWPGTFAGIEVDGRLLVDGGVRRSVPTETARSFGATFIIAVNPGFNVKKQKIDNVFQAMVQSVQIMGNELNMHQTSIADVGIIPELDGIDQFDFDKAEIIIKQGELAARSKIKELRRKIRFL